MSNPINNSDAFIFDPPTYLENQTSQALTAPPYVQFRVSTIQVDFNGFFSQSHHPTTQQADAFYAVTDYRNQLLSTCMKIKGFFLQSARPFRLLCQELQNLYFFTEERIDKTLCQLDSSKKQKNFKKISFTIEKETHLDQRWSEFEQTLLGHQILIRQIFRTSNIMNALQISPNLTVKKARMGIDLLYNQLLESHHTLRIATTKLEIAVANYMEFWNSHSEDRWGPVKKVSKQTLLPILNQSLQTELPEIARLCTALRLPSSDKSQTDSLYLYLTAQTTPALSKVHDFQKYLETEETNIRDHFDDFSWELAKSETAILESLGLDSAKEHRSLRLTHLFTANSIEDQKDIEWGALKQVMQKNDFEQIIISSITHLFAKILVDFLDSSSEDDLLKHSDRSLPVLKDFYQKIQRLKKAEEPKAPQAYDDMPEGKQEI